MVATNTQHTTQAVERANNGEGETDPQGRKIMRMHSKPGQQRKAQAPTEVISNMWQNATAEMRAQWLQIFTALLSSPTDATVGELANIADEAYFEFHARCNPSKYETRG